MESQVSPKNIEARVEAMAASANPKPIETPAPVVPVEPAKPVEAAKPEAAKPVEPAKPAEPAKPVEPVKPEAAKPVEPVKPVEKPVEKKQPNDPVELRKWSTKLSQENAALREDMKTIKAALDKLTKKPVDYAELAKNPDSLKAHIEAERQEAVKELQQQLADKNDLAVKNETMYERALREKDKVNYPRWEKLFPIMQTLAMNGDGRINWNQAPGVALDEAYALAEQLNPAEAPVDPTPVPVVEAKPTVPAVTEEQIQARIAEAVAKAKAETEANLRAEVNGGGIGSAGRGGRRDNNSSTEAFKTMPLKELKKVISKE